MLDLAQELLTLSQEMLTLAEQKDWQKLAELQAKREALIKELDALDLSHLNQTQITEFSTLIIQSRELERRCRQLAEAGRDILTSEHRKVSKGKAMQKAYGAYGKHR